MSLENSPKELDGWLMAKTTKRARARVAEIFMVWLFFSVDVTSFRLGTKLTSSGAGGRDFKASGYGLLLEGHEFNKNLQACKLRTNSI